MKGKKIIATLTLRYRLIRLLEISVLAIASGLLTYTVLGFFSSFSVAIGLGVGVTLFVFFTRFYFLKLHRVSTKNIAYYLNTRYPQLQASADILLQPEENLTTLQKLQLNRVDFWLQQVQSTIRFPNRIVLAVELLFVSVVLFVLTSYSTTHSGTAETLRNILTPKSTASVSLPPEIQKLNITIHPPAYTGKKSFNTTEPELIIAEGSVVQWTVAFNQPVGRPYLTFANRDTLFLTQTGNEFITKASFPGNDIYQINWNTDSTTLTSRYYKIESIADQAPVISIENLHQFIELDIEDNRNINATALLTDDYGIENAWIIATVSKGSGESVKFREEKLLFTTPEKIIGKNVWAARTINLDKLGMEPGDELYFYVEAYDNKKPTANQTRTETYFITLKDTASYTFGVDGGLGVDLMPEYFRSQRQIIIDSEKLISEKKKLSRATFNATSNELGYDQKVLRLRYGQFLGEEFETGIGHEALDEDDDHEHEHEHEEEDLAKKFGHVHDKENEHNLAPDNRLPTHSHQHEETEDGEPKNLMDAFMHKHDDEETATFFIESLRIKLKAALTLMWDAELYLRLFEPEKSLPYQYKALQLLKEISNDSRIYVHRIGFDPPPIKEEKRLTGDLSEVHSTRAAWRAEQEKLYPEIQRAIPLLEELIPGKQLTVDAKRTLELAGRELAAKAIEEPVRYLESLSLLKSYLDNTLKPGEETGALKKIRKAFWQMLPVPQQTPAKKIQHLHTLDEEFLHQLQTGKNE
ncbi:MAG: hypothetical protein KF845_07020 [Cyclobacteriaceae bacterium]|nr:hypothetical protein [Cyclobacteriaceae bacterium]